MSTADDFIARLIFVRDLTIPGDRSEFYRRARRGEYETVARGVYLPSETWRALNRDARYRALIHAVAPTLHSGTALSHDSAAALWRLPRIGPWPKRVHTVQDEAAGGRSNATVFRHTTGIPDACEQIDGLRVTPLARTVIDLARTATFAQAVAAADAALRRSTHPVAGVPRTRLTRDDLAAELDTVPTRHGSVKASAVVDFADGRADRPGESMSRVSMHLARLPAPELQARLTGASGRVWPVDFWWPAFNLIGEFDGRVKYSDPEFLAGRTPQQALADEKEREDDLRAAGPRMSRWGWEKAISPTKLRHHLVSAGLR